MLNKGDNLVTVGLDDTTKAAGHKLYDIKADHITVKGPNQNRKSFTTGYAENISHSGEDGGAAYEYIERACYVNRFLVRRSDESY